MAKDKNVEPRGAAKLKTSSNETNRRKKTPPPPPTVTEEGMVSPAKEGREDQVIPSTTAKLAKFQPTKPARHHHRPLTNLRPRPKLQQDQVKVIT